MSNAIETWITLEDLIGSVCDQYELARSEGHSRDGAMSHAAAFLAVHRDQIIHPAVSMGLVELLLSEKLANGEAK